MTPDFPDSDELTDRVIAVLFCWHCQYKSDRGFMKTTDGTSILQRQQKVNWMDTVRSFCNFVVYFPDSFLPHT